MTSATATVLDSPTPLATVPVFDTAGNPLALGSLWADKKVALVFVRHFGCLFCKEQVADVAARKADFESKGTEIVIIGNGSVEDARAFAAEHGRGFRVLTDPERTAYCEAGMKSGVTTSFSLGVAKNAMRAMSKGFRQTKTQGAVTQQGGIVVMAPGGRELYRHVSDVAGDHPAIDDVLRALT